MSDVGLWAQLACLWEVCARKPGNVHRHVDFADVGLVDFLASAAALRPAFDNARQSPIGQTVHRAVAATRRVVSTNTNLGMILLLVPLAAAPDGDLRQSVETVLDGLTVADAQEVYRAIRLAHPGGLGTVESQDVAEEPTQPLRAVMALAADRDLVARQYANGFREVLQEGVPALRQGLERLGCLEGAILHAHLSLLAHYPDSLIARKRGRAESEEASHRAGEVLHANWPFHPESHALLSALDSWLRSHGHARNPGTTADLVTASLFASLREGFVSPSLPWTSPELFPTT